MFSSRLPASLGQNSLAAAIDRLRASATPFIDLTVTNPTVVGLPYPVALLEPLASADSLTYRPAALGLTGAREAVAREYQRQGTTVPPERVVLTASTSEAYSLLFKLLCDAGDEVLIPQPSYPLFDLLSRLDNVRAVPYRLQEHAGWSIDRASVEQALSPRTRAILVVSPNNPTGSVTSVDDARWLSSIGASRGVAIIADEVFADYPLSTNAAVGGPATNATVGELSPSVAADSALARFADALTFRLGGLSKSAGLPQVKLGWMALGGPDALVASALERLELIADTYLSVATPVQMAAASLIECGAPVRAAILDRIRGNLKALRSLAGARPDVTVVSPEAGWSAMLQLPATEPEDEIVLRLLNERGVLVHPGYFFDLPHEAFLIVSLLPEPTEFAEGIRRVLAR